MNIRKSLAGVAAGALALAGITVVAAPTAQAAGFSGTGVSFCHLYFATGLPGNAGTSSMRASNSSFVIDGLTLSNYSPVAGETVTVTLTSTGLRTGPADVVAGGLNLSATVALAGAQTGTVALTAPSLGLPAVPNVSNVGNYPATTTLQGYNPMGPITLTGTFVASGSGALTASYQRLAAIDLSGANATNYCDGQAGGTATVNSADAPNDTDVAQTSNYVSGGTWATSGFRVVNNGGVSWLWNVPITWSPQFAAVASSTIQATASVTGPNAAVASVNNQQAGVTGYARTGDVITMSGTAWAANLAAGSFTTTVNGTPATNTLSTNGSGALSGTVTVAAGTSSGLGTVSLTQGAIVATAPITILAPSSITLSTYNAGPGNSVTVTGSSFNPNAPVYIFPKKGNTFTQRAAALAGFNNLSCPSATASLNPTGAPQNYYSIVGPFIPANTKFGDGLIGASGDFVAGTKDCGTAVVATADSSGNLTATVTVTAGMDGVLAVETTTGSTYPANLKGSQSNGRSALSPAFTVSADSCTSSDADNDINTPGACKTEQTINATVTGGVLSQKISGFVINMTCAETATVDCDGDGNFNEAGSFASVATQTSAVPMSAPINSDTITDLRGGAGTWSLTGQLKTSSLTGSGTAAGSSIAASNLTMSNVVCTPDGSSVPLGTPSTALTGGLGAAQTLCGNPQVNPLTNSTSGKWTAAGTLNLSVPAYQMAGAYTGTLVLTLT